MRIVNKFDPFGLITAAECPDDEYSPEISDILVGLKNCSNEQDVSKLVAQIFNDAFSSNQAGEDYREIGEEIWEWWQKQQTQNLDISETTHSWSLRLGKTIRLVTKTTNMENSEPRGAAV